VDLKPTEEQQAIIEAIRDFAKSEVRPANRECEEAGQVAERIEKQLLEMGVSAPVPEEFGGQGSFDTMSSVLIAEELSWGDPGVAFSVLGSGLPATIIDMVGTDQQRKDLLPKFVDGARGFVALAERDAGADFTLLETKSDGGALTGLKYGVLNADVAPVRLVVAGEAGALGIWIVPEAAEISSQKEDKLGLRSARTFKVWLDGVEGRLLGGDNPGLGKVKRALLRAKLLNAGVALGLARAALEYATTYAQERTAFGRPIGAFQGISFKIADRAMDLETARLLVWNAAWAVDNEREDMHQLVMSACGHAVAAAVANADDGVQILGGHGYMRDHPEELWYRDAMTLATFDSPSMVGDLFLAKSYEVQE
jgi:acyl-CoA dehydrogenase